MHKFRIGDRVRCIAAFDGNTKIVGVAGTVMRESSIVDHCIGVAFDKTVSGHDGTGHSWYRRCGAERGWNVPPSYVRYCGMRVNPDKVDIGKREAAQAETLTRLWHSAFSPMPIYIWPPIETTFTVAPPGVSMEYLRSFLECEDSKT